MPDSTSRLLALLRSEGRPLHALLTRLTLNPHVAEDLMQDLFLKLANNPAFAIAKNPAAYLRQSAIHLALDWRRARRNKNHHVSSAESIAPAPPLAETLSNHEECARILDAAADLPAQTREAFVLHYLQNLSFAEIADSQNKTPHQIRALCHKALTLLRTQLAPAPKEPSHARQ